MAVPTQVFIVSDVHYAGAEERQRRDYEFNIIQNPLLRLAVKAYRHFIWLRDPFAHNHLLDCFLAAARGADIIVANGDYSCDTAFVGVSDAAAAASAGECLDRLRLGTNGCFLATIGDHELGKKSLVGGVGGLRLASWQQATTRLKLQPFWQHEIGRYTLIGVTSSLVAFPVYEPDALAPELESWRELRTRHIEDICDAFSRIERSQRVILFCHDPTALPFLWLEARVRARVDQIERTVIGHLHSRWILRQSQMLAGLPTIAFCGNAIRRMSSALSQARHWQAFRPLLCPSLSGLEIAKDGGFYSLNLDPTGLQRLASVFHPLGKEGRTRRGN